MEEYVLSRGSSLNSADREGPEFSGCNLGSSLAAIDGLATLQICSVSYLRIISRQQPIVSNGLRLKIRIKL